MGRGSAIWLDEEMHHWIRLTADRGPELSVEAEKKLDELVGDDGVIVTIAEVERIQIDDEDNEVLMAFFIHPFNSGNVQGYRIISDGFENGDKSEFNSKCLQLKPGDLVLLSGSSVKCSFELWFLEKVYQINPRRDKYYSLEMDLLDIQKILNTEERKKYTIDSYGKFVIVNQNSNHGFLKKRVIKELKEYGLPIAAAGIIIFICYILGIDL